MAGRTKSIKRRQYLYIVTFNVELEPDVVGTVTVNTTAGSEDEAIGKSSRLLARAATREFLNVIQIKR